MKAVMISIQPQWCELIANGEKTIEVRKTRPNIETPFKCYIYCTKDGEETWTPPSYDDIHDCVYGYVMNGNVIGEFVCDKIEVLDYLTQIPDIALQKGHAEIVSYRNVEPFYGGKVATIHSTCLSNRELLDYGKGKTLYAWHISDLKIYDEPKELKEFRKEGFMTEEDWHFALYPNTHCHYAAWAKKFEMSRPPQSWCYCEELEESKNE